MSKNILIEGCVTSVTSAIEAQKGGALRVELCDNIYDGGTTPSYGAVHEARKNLDIALNIMIRPRGGDFCYSDLEFDIMKTDVEMAKELAADGIVFGILNTDGTIDMERSREIIEIAKPLSVTFHRAFDRAINPLDALEDLILLGVKRILTSGQRPSAMEGRELLTELVKRAGDRIIIMPAVDIDETNIRQLIDETGATEYHVFVNKKVPSRMTFRNEKVYMGTDPHLPEYEISITNWEQIRQICQKAQNK